MSQTAAVAWIAHRHGAPVGWGSTPELAARSAARMGVTRCEVEPAPWTSCNGAARALRDRSWRTERELLRQLLAAALRTGDRALADAIDADIEALAAPPSLDNTMDENVIAHAFHHNAFLIVSNGDRARYGSITSEWEHFLEWKRLDEADKGSLEAEVLLNGMLAHERLLDIVENFILFDESKPGATRKVIARNHQVLGVNRAVASVARQEELKLEFPPERRLRHRVVELPLESRAPVADLPTLPMAAEPPPPPYVATRPVGIVELGASRT